jgi:hypothetical protein
MKKFPARNRNIGYFSNELKYHVHRQLLLNINIPRLNFVTSEKQVPGGQAYVKY